MSVSKKESQRPGSAHRSPGPQKALNRPVCPAIRPPAAPATKAASAGRISPLRRRMIRAMELAGLTAGTQRCYLGAVTALQEHTGTRPDRLTEKQVYQYILWLRDDKGVAKGTFQTQWYGIKLFYYRTLGVNWPLFTRKKVRQPRRKRLPHPVAWDDGRRLIAKMRKPGYRLCYSFMLALGLRFSDAVNLTVQAVDANNMIVRVIGKGNKERILPLPSALLKALRLYWLTHRNPHLLFPNRKGTAPFSNKSLRRAFTDARDRCGLDNHVTPHSLRHYADSRIMPTRLAG